MNRIILAALCISLVAVAAQAGTVAYTFEEISPGTWNVYAQVLGGDSKGLSAYSVWVYGDTTATFTENILGTVNSSFAPIGFQASTLVQGPIVQNFNAGNFQSFTAPIYNIGITAVDNAGGFPGMTPHVQLGVPALLGTLTTVEGLGAGDFAGTSAGLFNLAGNGYLSSVDVTTTVIPIPEPATMAMLLIGGGLAVLRRRRSA